MATTSLAEKLFTGEHRLTRQEMEQRFTDTEWDGRIDIPCGLRMRLKAIDRNVDSLMGLVRMLERDRNGKLAAAATGIPYEGMHDGHLDTMKLAVCQLGEQLEATLEEIRLDSYTPSKN